MGGSIGVTIREENGKEHRMCRWTNSTPYFIKSMDFINKKQEHLDEYLKTWYDMVEEYESGAYKKKQQTMADVYAPNPFLAPMGYGLLVVDYKTNTVLHHQGYTSYEVINLSQLSLSLDSDPEDVAAIKELFDNGKINRVEQLVIKKGKAEIKSRPVKKWNALVKMAENYADFKWSNLPVDMTPWTVKSYGTMSDDLKEVYGDINDMRAEVKKLGFVLTKEEEEIWDEFTKERDA